MEDFDIKHYEKCEESLLKIRELLSDYPFKLGELEYAVAFPEGIYEMVKTVYKKGEPIMSFWKVAERSKEGDVLECVTYPMQKVVNNGDYTFMWEEDWKRVELSGEFLGMEWKNLGQY